MWGLCVHPSKQLFASAGGDRTIRVGSLTEMLKVSEQFQDDITSLDWQKPDGKFLVAGDRKGYAHLLDGETLSVLGKAQCKTKGWVEDVKFSPNG